MKLTEATSDQHQGESSITTPTDIHYQSIRTTEATSTQIQTMRSTESTSTQNGTKYSSAPSSVMSMIPTLLPPEDSADNHTLHNENYTTESNEEFIEEEELNLGWYE